MASLNISRMGRALPVLIVLMSGALVQALNLNDILSSSDQSSSDNPSSSVSIITCILGSSSTSSASSVGSSTSSDVIEPSTSSDDPEDSSYVPGPEDSSSVSSDASSSVSHSATDLSSVDESESVPDPSYVPSDDGDGLPSSASSLSSSLSSVSSGGISASDSDDPSDVKPTNGSVLTVELLGEIEPKRKEKKKPKRVPVELSRQPKEKGKGDGSGGAKRNGRPPSVFKGEKDAGVTRGEDHGRRPLTSGDEEGLVKSNGKPSRGGSKPRPEQGKGSLSNKPGRQRGESPSRHQLKELRAADKSYLDLYLCGQFLPGSADSRADDFAVISFNYAGRTQPFSPCSALDSTEETVNYIHRTSREDASAFQQVLDDLPDTWQRYQSEKGVAPQVVHLFTFNMPESVAAASTLLRLRREAPYRSARFVLGYVNQPSTAGDSPSPDAARVFIDLLDELDEFDIETIRICGRCAKVAGSTGRRRAAMQFGMSAIPADDFTGSGCQLVQEHAIPGTDLARRDCDGFQKSITRCALRSVQRRCPKTDFANDLSRGVGADDKLLNAVNRMTRVCSVDGDCWRGKGESIRRAIMPKNESDSCRMSARDLGKMLARCSSISTGLPFDA